jgi:hypothetical protein
MALRLVPGFNHLYKGTERFPCLFAGTLLLACSNNVCYIYGRSAPAKAVTGLTVDLFWESHTQVWLSCW